MKGVKYSEPPPAEYHCSKCSAAGVKLWRPYQTSCVELHCYDCAKLDQPGRGAMPNTDQVGWLVPAIPDEEGMSYWGYTSVPPLGCDWWWRLPPFADSKRVLAASRAAQATLESLGGPYFLRISNENAAAIGILAAREGT